jgi:hypothetical protein
MSNGSETKSVTFVKWNAFLLERICNTFLGNISVTDKSFQIVERILKSNKTEKPFRFTFGTNNLEMIPNSTFDQVADFTYV